MNTEYQDILNTIQRNPGLTSSEIAEKMEIKGYYRTMKTAEAAEKVSKISDKLRQKGHVISEKIKHPVTGNTVNAWSPVPDQDKEQEQATTEQDHTESNLVMVSENSNQPTEAAMEKPAEYSPEEITDAVIEAIQNQAEKPKPFYRLEPKKFILTDGVETEVEIFVSRGEVRIDDLVFDSDDQVDEFAEIIKDLLKKAA